MKTAIFISCILAAVASCPGRRASATMVTADVIWSKFDEYSHIPFLKEKRRLKNFATQLRAEKNSTAYIVAHAGRLSCKGEAQARAERAKRYLIRSGRIEANRIRIIDAGYQEEWIIALYSAPLNAPPLTTDIAKVGYFEFSAEKVQILGACTAKFLSN